MLDFPGGGWGWKNLGDVGSVVCMLNRPGFGGGSNL